MKNIYLIQNSNLSFDMDISKIYSPNKYTLFLVINSFGLKKLKGTQQEQYFKQIWETENFNFDHLREIISCNQANNSAPLQIVTNAEEAIVVCGQLRVFFNNDKLNYDRFKNKLLMKELLQKHRLLTPKHIVFDKQVYTSSPSKYIQSILTLLTFPLIAKPIDAMGCIGIQKLGCLEKFLIWCNKAILTDDQYEIDEFIDGKVYNCDSFIKNNKIVFTQVSECSNSCYDFLCGQTKGTIALQHHDELYKLLCDYTVRVHDTIQTPSGGVTHLEVILTPDNQLYFVEIGHRSPGILIPAMYKKFLNIDTIESHILLQIDDDFELNIKFGVYSAWIAFPIQNGRLKSKNTPSIASNYHLEWTKEVGDSMNTPLCGRDYAGRMLLWNSDYTLLKKDFNDLSSYQFYNVTSRAA